MKIRIALLLGLAACAAAPLQRPRIGPVHRRRDRRVLRQPRRSGGGDRRRRRARSGSLRAATDDCAVQEAGRIAFVAEERGHGDVRRRRSARARRRWCFAARSARVDGLVFINVRVADGNGAGIRIEQGDLKVAWTRCSPTASAGSSPPTIRTASISIDHSTFSGLGKHPDGNGAHSLYIGDYGAPQRHQQPLRARHRRPLSEEPGGRGSRSWTTASTTARAAHQLPDRPVRTARSAGSPATSSSTAPARRITAR